MLLKLQSNPISLFWIYFALGSLTVFAVYKNLNFLEFSLRVISIFVLGFLYYLRSPKRDSVYFTVLFFAAISNILLNIDSTLLLTIGITLFILNRALCTLLILKYTEKVFYFTLIIGFILFFSPMLYLLLTSNHQDLTIVILGIINVFVTALIGAVSLSNYIMDSTLKEVYLLLSSLLFIVIACMYMIEKFYLSIPMYGPLRVVVLMTAHYLYYLYLVHSERRHLNA